MLTEDELNRYKRQINIQGWGRDAQEGLKDAIVFVAGAGGLGSSLLFYLTVSGIGTIRIADYDKIVLSNLNRQILHSDARVGKYKVDSAYDSLKDVNSNVNLIKIYDKIVKSNIEALVDDANIIIDCLDNVETRHILNAFSVKNGVPMIHAGVSEFYGQITFLHPPETPCLACFFPTKTDKKSIPIVGATAGVIGSLQALEAIKFFAGIEKNLKNQLLIWDGKSMTFRTIKLKRNPKCRICRDI